jgi:multiple sugar transport system substrate-binding protein
MNNLNMRTMRLTVLILVLVFCGTTLFAGGAKENPKAGPVALRWMMQAGTPTEVEQWKELAADVTKKYPNITVTLETTDFSSYWTKLPAEIASGTTADILYMQSLRTKGFAEKAARPMNDYINADKELDYKDFVEAIMNGLSVDGKIYGLPYDIGPYMLFYNADLFDRYGVPYPDDKMDWRGFLDRARKLTRDGNYGYAISTHFDRSIPFIWGNGGVFFDKSGRYNIMDPKTIEALKFYHSLLAIEKVAQPIADTGNVNQDRETFYSGKAGMYMDGPWNITNIKRFGKFRVGAAPMVIGVEKRVTPTIGSGFMISKTSKFPEETYRAITVITSKQSLEKLATWGRALPARKSVMSVFAKNHSDVIGLSQALEVSAQPGVSVAYEAPATYQEAYQILVKNLTEPVLVGKETVEVAAAKTQRLLDGIRP